MRPRRCKTGTDGINGTAPRASAILVPAMVLPILTVLLARCGEGAERAGSPNIVVILADDLGYGDLGCYGQKRIRTPNIDRLAAEGMRFTAHYAGNNVCAPSRCVLMTGLHPGRAYIRNNRQAKDFPEGQEPVPAGYLSLPLTFKRLGYTLGGFGKWGLGPVGSTGDPMRQGFDRFFGYNCQAVAHNYYPTHLWDNDRQVALENPKFAAHQKLPAGADPNSPASYTAYSGKQYAPDLIGQQALAFIRDNKDRPFLLYYPTTVPHLALQVPEDSLKEYEGKFPEEPYPGGRGYLPHRTPRAAYAAMITRMDREVGRVADLVKELGLDDRTIFVFTSDNGPLYDRLGGTDTEFFASNAGLRGRKGSFHEGGFRVPCIVRWKGRVAAGTTSGRVTGFEDWLPTLLDLVGANEATPAGIDGVSFAPTLLGQKQPPREFLYRETPGYGGQQCVRAGDWKAYRGNLNPGPKAKDQGPGPIELYDLAQDPGETKNVAAEHSDVAARLQAIMDREHVKSEVFPLRALDDGPAFSTVPEMGEVPMLKGLQPGRADALAEQRAAARAEWLKQCPGLAPRITPELARSLSRWAKPQMEGYRQVPPLDKAELALVGEGDGGKTLVFCAEIDKLPVHAPLVTRWLQAYLRYDTATRTITGVTVTIRGQREE